MDRGRLTSLWDGARAWSCAACLACVGVVLAALSILAASAGAATFGVPLGTAPFNVAPNYPYDCSVVVLPFVGPTTLANPSGTAPAGSCIWIHVPSPGETAAAGGRNISLEPPGTGTVTRISVGVGATSGPMRAVVMRALYSNTLTPGHPNDACCTPVAYGPVFTPRPNAITTINVNLPVREDPTPPPEDITTIADFDTVGLAVLAPGVPVPLYYTGDPSQPADFVWNTSSPSTVVPGVSSDPGGFFVAMNGTWIGSNPVGLGAGTAPVRGNNATVTLRCLLIARCTGRLLLQSGRLAGAPALDVRGGGGGGGGIGAIAVAATTYGSTSFRIAGRHRASVRVRLSPAGRRLLGRRRSATVWANMIITGGRSYSSRLTLRR